ncbi:MAG: hypothetical protein PHO08_01225 [Methylococcales bacterium]|nr:hypothetical protein [Methylococcales bacterium]
MHKSNNINLGDAIVAVKAAATRLTAHGASLDEILDLEGWDKNKLEMPAGIRVRIENADAQ